MNDMQMNWLKKILSPSPTSTTAHTANSQQSNAFERVGGEKVIKALAHQFYQQMQTLDETQALLAIHRAPIEESEQKLYEFLSGWLGGPNLYQEKHGHPALRARHMPFKVDDTMVEQWLLCMNNAIEMEIAEPQHREAIFQAISTLAKHMRNQ